MVPGLGAVHSLTGALALVATWTRGTVLDLPGFGHSGPTACDATVPALADAVASWLTDHAAHPVVLAGHSTGAQAALRAAFAAPETVGALMLAGLTFAPSSRRLAGLARAWLLTVPHEPPSGLPVAGPDYVRAGGRALARFVRSGLLDRPEETIGRVPCPVLLASGVHDHFSPPAWIDDLASDAPRVRAVTVGGSHAFPYSHPLVFCALIRETADMATGRSDIRYT